MAISRKKYIVDKKFQIGISFKAIILPLVTTLAASGVILFYANNTKSLIDGNNRLIEEIVENQDDMITMFLTTPALQKPDSPALKDGVSTFKKNIGTLKKISKSSTEITENNSLVFYLLIAMAVVQTIIIFSLFIFLSHKISGPIHVMTGYLRDIKEGNAPRVRPLRKNDELKIFYSEFCETIECIRKKTSKD